MDRGNFREKYTEGLLGIAYIHFWNKKESREVECSKEIRYHVISIGY